METTTNMRGSSSRNGSSGVIIRKERMSWGIENPFALKMFQVYTGFGIGCGIGIGLGSPLNLGIKPFSTPINLLLQLFIHSFYQLMNLSKFLNSTDDKIQDSSSIPMLGEVMSAARGATNAFSGVERHVNSSLRTLGAKNIKAGVGCGIGFGHGFGVGLAVKPRVVHQIQSSLVQAFASMITRLGMVPSLSLGQSIVPQSLQSGVQIANQTINSSNTTYSSSQLFTSLPMISNVPTNRSEGMPPDPSSTKVDPLRTLAPTSRTEKVLSKFLENLMHEDGEQNEKAKHLHLENYMLQMVVKHQMLIQELMEENEKMRHILVEDLKIPPNKLQSSYPIRNKFSCSDCLDCRRKMRKR